MDDIVSASKDEIASATKDLSLEIRILKREIKKELKLMRLAGKVASLRYKLTDIREARKCGNFCYSKPPKIKKVSYDDCAV